MSDQGRYKIRLKELMDGGIQRGMADEDLCAQTQSIRLSFHCLSIAGVNALLPSLDNNRSSDWH